MPTIYERVQAVVADMLNLVYTSGIQEGTRFVEDLNADSLDLLALIMALEEEFSIDGIPIAIPDQKPGEIKTVGEVVTWLKVHEVKDQETEEVRTGSCGTPH